MATGRWSEAREPEGVWVGGICSPRELADVLTFVPGSGNNGAFGVMHPGQLLGSHFSEQKIEVWQGRGRCPRLHKAGFEPKTISFALSRVAVSLI